MSEIVGTLNLAFGETIPVRNESPRAARYRIVFTGGAVCFEVLPGARFEITNNGGVISMNVDGLAPAGIAPVPDVDGDA